MIDRYRVTKQPSLSMLTAAAIVLLGMLSPGVGRRSDDNKSNTSGKDGFNTVKWGFSLSSGRVAACRPPLVCRVKSRCKGLAPIPTTPTTRIRALRSTPTASTSLPTGPGGGSLHRV